MFKFAKRFTIAASLVCLTIPAMAQNAEPEEARTTYQVTFLKLAPDAESRWLEIQNDHFSPAREAAGLPQPAIHYLANGPWDLMVVTRMPNGMAALDSHNPAASVAYQAALRQREGSQEAVDALGKEMDALVQNSDRFFTHTHP
jgi:hypothetical protein